MFDEAYAANPLVNAMCVGLLPTERVLSAKATGAGNLLVLYGALTGRDGIGGASVLASQDLEGSDEKRPSVQIGDPFRGKALIEVSLDLVERDLVARLQDCGAAGLASSLAEMARGDAGVDVHLDRVPLREPDLEPWEIMISESQERMVAVVAPERLAEVAAACERWELPCTVIGEVTDHGELRAFFRGDVVGAIPADAAHRRVPALRDRAGAGPSRAAAASHPVEPRAEGRGSSSSTTSSSARAPSAGPASTPRCCASTACAGSPCRSTARRSASATRSAPAGRPSMDAALNVACAGGEPLALTDCLNFGNPEKRARSRWELGQAIEGIARAAEGSASRSSPGNVSLYNETGGRPIPPTPVVGCVGLVRDVTRIPSRWRARATRVVPAPRRRRRARRGSSGGTRTASRSRTTSPTAGSRSRFAKPRRGPEPRVRQLGTTRAAA